MSQAFDAYHKWLGIPPAEQPPNHYRLLGLAIFETDIDAIQSAAEQRISHVRSFQLSQYAEASQRILNELAAARLCLLNAANKSAYDRELRARLQEVTSNKVPPPVPRLAHVSPLASAPARLATPTNYSLASTVLARHDCSDAIAKTNAPATARLKRSLKRVARGRRRLLTLGASASLLTLLVSSLAYCYLDQLSDWMKTAVELRGRAGAADVGTLDSAGSRQADGSEPTSAEKESEWLPDDEQAQEPGGHDTSPALAASSQSNPPTAQSELVEQNASAAAVAAPFTPPLVPPAGQQSALGQSPAPPGASAPSPTALPPLPSRWQGFGLDGNAIIDDFVRITHGRLHTLGSYADPIVISVSARTNKNNIRVIAFGQAQVIWNWEVNPAELRVHRADGSVARAATTPLAANTWYKLRWIIMPSKTSVFVNNRMVFSESGHNYVGAPSQVWIESGDGSIVDVRSFEIKPLIRQPSGSAKQKATRYAPRPRAAAKPKAQYYVWEVQPAGGGPFKLRLFTDGRATRGESDDAEANFTWSQVGNQVVLRWPEGWVDTLLISMDGREMNGKNQFGRSVHGVLVGGNASKK